MGGGSGNLVTCGTAALPVNTTVSVGTVDLFAILWSSTLNLDEVGFFLASCIMFTVLWETSTHWLDHRLSHSPGYSGMVEHLYRELAALGLISFGLFIIEHFTHLDGDLLISFEFAHVYIFAVGVVFIAQQVLQMNRTQAAERHYLAISNMTTGDVKQAMAENKGGLSGQAGVNNSASAVLEYRLLNLIFEHEYSMPQGFDFAGYTRLKLVQHVGHSIEVSVKAWLFALTMALLAGGSAHLGKSGSGNALTTAGKHGQWLMTITVAWTMVLAQLMVFRSLRTAMKNVISTMTETEFGNSEAQLGVMTRWENERAAVKRTLTAQTLGSPSPRGRVDSFASDGSASKRRDMSADMLKEIAKLEDKHTFTKSMQKHSHLATECINLINLLAFVYYLLHLLGPDFKLDGAVVSVTAHLLQILPVILMWFYILPISSQQVALLSSIVKHRINSVHVLDCLC